MMNQNEAFIVEVCVAIYIYIYIYIYMYTDLDKLDLTVFQHLQRVNNSFTNTFFSIIYDFL
jgi:hypothetical protein